MNKTSNPELTANAQKLRKNMTKEERNLWYNFLKELPITINKQKVIGNYIVDFYCASAKIVIELDGSQHFEEQGKRYDEKRDEYILTNGFSVVRIPSDCLNDDYKI